MIPLVEVQFYNVRWPPGMKMEGLLTHRRYKGCLGYKFEKKRWQADTLMIEKHEEEMD